MSDTIRLSAVPVPTARALAEEILAARADAAVSASVRLPAQMALPAVAGTSGIPDLARSEQISVAVAALLVRYAEVMAGLADA